MDWDYQVNRVRLWTSLLTAEQKMKQISNIDVLLRYYYRTPEFSRFLESFLAGISSLTFIVGLQGTGKTSALWALRNYVSSNGPPHYWRWGEDYRKEWEMTGDCKYLLIDLPDYAAGNVRAMNRDLDQIGRLWYDSRFTSRRLVIAVQKEMFRGHYLFGKGEVFELRPLRIRELVDYYYLTFKDYVPFSVEALQLVAKLSRGVFRRYLRYIRLCVEDMVMCSRLSVGVEDVERIVTKEVVMRDMDLELSGFLRGQEKTLVASALQLLSMEGDKNQKELASALGVPPAGVGRLLLKLETMGYIDRVRGNRKEFRVQLKDP